MYAFLGAEGLVARGSFVQADIYLVFMWILYSCIIFFHINIVRLHTTRRLVLNMKKTLENTKVMKYNK